MATIREHRKPVRIAVGDVILDGTLAIPDGAKSMVLFAHGSGSSRLSPRNVYVAEVLKTRGIGTLLFDLLTEEEDRDYDRRFDIKLLTGRLIATTHWMRKQPEGNGLWLGYFGASTGAASALQAAAEIRDVVRAVVCRGGRPDLAGSALERVKAPTLFIVGDLDHFVLELNRKAMESLTAVKELVTIEGASHLFEEPGTLERAAVVAADWFDRQMRADRQP
jgi:putative phosphoribosyl transferase